MLLTCLVIYSVSFKNPIEWVREAVGSNVREKSSEQEIAAARKAQIEKGEASVFESIAPVAADKAKVTGAKIVKAKKMHTEVREQAYGHIAHGLNSANIL